MLVDRNASRALPSGWQTELARHQRPKRDRSDGLGAVVETVHRDLETIRVLGAKSDSRSAMDAAALHRKVAPVLQGLAKARLRNPALELPPIVERVVQRLIDNLKAKETKDGTQ